MFDVYTKFEMSAGGELIRRLADLWLKKRRNHPTQPQQTTGSSALIELSLNLGGFAWHHRRDV